jgi:ABC-type bacteriocin/lantibiotic exporter with double-glycine peptidase domain
VPPKPKYFGQSLHDSCVPTCLRTVIAAAGKDVLEYEIRALCECDGTGTAPSNAVKAAVSLGFDGSYLARLEFDELAALLTDGNLPITYLEIGKEYHHAIVVYEIEDGKVLINDPANRQKGHFRLEEFIPLWEATRGLTIVVKK